MPYFLSPCLPDHHHQFTSSNLMIFRKTSTFVRGTHKTVGVLLFLPDEFMQPTSCFLPISEIPQKAINKENDPDQTCFPGKLHMLLGRAQKHVFFYFSLLCGTCTYLPSPSRGSWHLFVSTLIPLAGVESLFRWRHFAYGYRKN